MTIEQIDRDAAADFLENWEPGSDMTVVKLARAFAAHRQAAYERAAKLCEALAESTYETAEARDAALGCAQFILAMQ